MNNSKTHLKNCECNCGCQDAVVYTPLKIFNPPGQSSLSYRIGTHAKFKSDMMLAILSEPTLKNLKTRDDSDLSIALMDSWALVADVLTFYQERVANEGFLRTAIERRSILELARTIGYELRPGLAASTYLAFSMDSATGSPKKAKVGIGTKVQSIPLKSGELPQIFETIEDVEVHKSWNEISPQQKEEQDLETALGKGVVVVDGTSTKVKPGDGLFFVVGGKKAAFVLAQKVDINSQNQQTEISFDKNPVKVTCPSTIVDMKQQGKQDKTKIIDTSAGSPNLSDVCKIVVSPWTEQDLQTKTTIEGWSMDDLVDAVNSMRENQNLGDAGGDALYVFRIKCGIFGNLAPRWDSLPPELRYDYKPQNTIYTNKDRKELTSVPATYPDNWDDGNGVSVNKVSRLSDGKNIYLDNVYQNILPSSWVVLANSSKTSAFRVKTSFETSLTGFAMTSKVTGLELGNNKSNDWISISYKPPNTISADLDSFYFRTTTVYAAPERLQVVKIKKKEPVDGNNLFLDAMIGGLSVGRPIAISGELDGQPGIARKEIAFLSSIVHFEEGKLLTKLYLQTPPNQARPLLYEYKRDTVRINSNVSKATHGETKEVSIGSGNPTQRFQEFPLKHNPLTYLLSNTASGALSTLEITTDGIKWNEVSSFEETSPSDRVYTTRISNDAKTSVIFGDGDTGRLPPAGQENIKAKYRVGLGRVGLLAADQLSILMTKPLGVRGVTNPLQTFGAEDPENLDNARKNAPRTVLTMDRIVSLEDYENFAQGFASIGKAISYTIEISGIDVVLVAVSGEDGQEITLDVHDALVSAIDSYKDPAAVFTVRSFNRKTFNIDAKILVSSDRKFDDVKPKVVDALENNFDFENRDFGQAVTISEVIHVIKVVEGVEAVDIESLCEDASQGDSGHDDGGKEEIIRAAGVEDYDGVIIPSLLLINKNKITIEEMQSL